MKTVKKTFLLLLLVGLCSSCTVLKDYPKPMELHKTVKGSRIILFDSKDKIIMEGELIAVSEDSVFLLNLSPQYLRGVGSSTFQRAEILVSLTSDDPGAFSAWAAIMCLISLAHGYYGILTLPLNIVVGATTATNAAQGIYKIIYPDNISLENMKKFARFPQGIPDSVDRSALK